MSLTISLNYLITKKYTQVFSTNITHNLREMANEAGLYEAIWHPYKLHKDYFNSDEDQYYDRAFEYNYKIKARRIIPFLRKGLKKLKKDPKKYAAFDSANGWGDYHGLVSFVEKYLEACEEYRSSIILTC
jgi:hypothetical protein